MNGFGRMVSVCFVGSSFVSVRHSVAPSGWRVVVTVWTCFSPAVTNWVA